MYVVRVYSAAILRIGYADLAADWLRNFCMILHLRQSPQVNVKFINNCLEDLITTSYFSHFFSFSVPYLAIY
jgi:hypothetical protein